MKITLRELRAVVESVVLEAKCPECGDSNAYLGLNNYECSTQGCSNYSPKQVTSTPIHDRDICAQCGESTHVDDMLMTGTGKLCPSCVTQSNDVYLRCDRCCVQNHPDDLISHDQGLICNDCFVELNSP